MDMDEYQRSHAIWLRRQKETSARVQEARNSALALCGRPTSDENRRGWVLSRGVTILVEQPSEVHRKSIRAKGFRPDGVQPPTWIS